MKEHTAMLLPFPQVQLWKEAPWKEAPPVASLSQCTQPKKAKLLEDLNIDPENLSIQRRLLNLKIMIQWTSTEMLKLMIVGGRK